MQKPTFLRPLTFISGAAAMVVAGTIFLSLARADQSVSKVQAQGFTDNDQQGSTQAAQQTPASSAAQDSSGASATPKPADKATPDAKAATKAPAKKSTASSSKADAPAKTSSGSAPADSSKQAATVQAGQTGTTKTAQTGATKSAQAGTAKSGKTATSKTATAKTAAPLTLNTDKDKQSYAIGINVGKGLSQNLKQTGLEIEPAILTRAIKDVLAGDKQSMTDQEAQETLKTLQADLRKRQEELRKEQEAKMQQLGEANKKEGDEFLAANKAKEGVSTLPDGMQYKILQEGTGPKPAATDTVTVNYRGTLVNGTEFDSSYKRGQPATFNVTGIIKGWTEALELMPVGSKWQLFIPSDLAYGPSGRPPVIGPNSTLVFEVDLISIQPRPAPPTPAGQATAPAPTAAPAANAPTPNSVPTPNAPTPAPKPTPPAPKSDPAPTPNPAPKPPKP